MIKSNNTIIHNEEDHVFGGVTKSWNKVPKKG